MNNLLNNVELVVVEAAAAAGTSTLTSDSIDTKDCTGVLFLAHLGDVTDTSVLGFAIHDSDDDVTFDDLANPLAFTAGASNADNKLLALEVVRPTRRYVRAVLTRGTANAVLNGITAIKFGVNHAPVTQGATVLASDTLPNPARA